MSKNGNGKGGAEGNTTQQEGPDVAVVAVITVPKPGTMSIQLSPGVVNAEATLWQIMRLCVEGVINERTKRKGKKRRVLRPGGSIILPPNLKG